MLRELFIMKILHKLKLCFLFFLVLLGNFPLSIAADINKTGDGVAIEGYDPTAYFTENRPVKGSAEFSFNWAGATWHFANEHGRGLFAKNPEKYAPQFGGYCAWAVSQDYTAKGNPKNWTIVDGKLYLNYNDEIQERWEKDIPGFIAKAKENWPGVLDN